MRTVHFELLRPSEIVEERRKCPVVFVPVGPLEWHGPHLPLGTDPLNAQFVAARTAEKTGGVVMPTLFWGIDQLRPYEKLRDLGFKGDERIIGMDFPDNTMSSLYCREEVFTLIVREYLRLLVEQGYKLIVLVNGHGGANHVPVLKRLAEEFTYETDCRVVYTMALIDENGLSLGFGHATTTETSIISYVQRDSVDINELPPKDQPLKNTRWAIIDGDTFRGKPNADFTVREDPRDASFEMGKEIIEKAVSVITSIVERNKEELGILVQSKDLI